MQTIKSYSLASCKTTVDLIQTIGTLDDTEQISYTTYGVRLVNESGDVVFIQEDISTSQEFVEEFIVWCIDGEARSETFAYHVEDYLAEHM